MFTLNVKKAEPLCHLKINEYFELADNNNLKFLWHSNHLCCCDNSDILDRHKGCMGKYAICDNVECQGNDITCDR